MNVIFSDAIRTFFRRFTLEKAELIIDAMMRHISDGSPLRKIGSNTMGDLYIAAVTLPEGPLLFSLCRSPEGMIAFLEPCT